MIYLASSSGATTLPSATALLNRHLNPAKTSGPTIAPHSQLATYRLVVTQRILQICSYSTYDNVTDFEWYLSVLVDLAYVGDSKLGTVIRDQLVDVVGRVRAARRFAVQLMFKLLSDESLMPTSQGDEVSCSEVLWAAAWICGEYCIELAEPQELLNYLLQPSVAHLPPETTAVFIHAASKITGFWLADLALSWEDSKLPEARSVVESVIAHVETLTSNSHIEVQERVSDMPIRGQIHPHNCKQAANTLQLLTFVHKDFMTHRPRSTGFAGPEVSRFDQISFEPDFPKSLYLLRPLFTSYELKPVGKNAQRSVPIPEGLDLSAWVIPSQEFSQDKEISEELAAKSIKGKHKDASQGKVKKRKKKTTQVEDKEISSREVEEFSLLEQQEHERVCS